MAHRIVLRRENIWISFNSLGPTYTYNLHSLYSILIVPDPHKVSGGLQFIEIVGCFLLDILSPTSFENYNCQDSMGRRNNSETCLDPVCEHDFSRFCTSIGITYLKRPFVTFITLVISRVSFTPEHSTIAKALFVCIKLELQLK